MDRIMYILQLTIFLNTDFMSAKAVTATNALNLEVDPSCS